MASAFTPGPWTAKPDPGDHDGEWIVLARAGDDFRSVAHGMEERDACAVAAFPELVSAIDDLLLKASWRDPRGNILPEFQRAYDALQMVLSNG